MIRAALHARCTSDLQSAASIEDQFRIALRAHHVSLWRSMSAFLR